MAHVCRQCSRINPPDAAFCYWDGALLAGRGTGPIHAGSAPFPNQFIFPGGQACRNFDQLATTCQQHWRDAVGLLKQGFFAGFFNGIGRADLAQVAKDAAKFPDADRGLDQLLARLPTEVLQPPNVKVEPSAISLGVVPVGSDRTLDVHLNNLGMRLAYGSIASDCKWLALGEGQGAAQKLFQFRAEAVIPIHVKGQFLRAGNQPLEGHLILESNGGAAAISVRADVPITPFTEGMLAGSYTPRQIAEKARAHPREAAALFEKGLVARWFTTNGWTYPVQGPMVGGLGGVQQFFEALGLAKPPKVELKTPSILLRGAPGQTLTAFIEVGTPEKKHVFAFAVSDRPWVVPGTGPKEAKSPTMATIPLAIAVPGAPGQALQAKITVTANGNQKFSVPLTLTVTGSPADYVPAHVLPVPAAVESNGPANTLSTPVMATPIPATPVMATPVAPTPMSATPVMATAVEAPRIPARGGPAGPAGGKPRADANSASPFAFPSTATWSRGSAPPTLPAVPLPGLPTQGPGVEEAEPVIDLSRYRKRRKSAWAHLVPLLGLILVLVGLMLRDLIGKPPGEPSFEVSDIDPTQRLKLYFDYGNQKGLRNSMNFGLVMVDPANPQDPDPKRLTFDPFGRSNSTVLSIDGAAKTFGGPEGRWEGKPAKSGIYGGQVAKFEFTPLPVFVTQTVQVMPGEAVEVTPGVYKRLLNTCLIKYKVENKDTRSHKLGLRIMVDTLIGKNDGTPFTIPGVPGLVATMKDFPSRQEIPDFIQALEFPDLEGPGTVIQMNLKLSDQLAPDRVSLTHWPGWNYGAWDVHMENIAEDSAIVLYWNPVELKPGASREMAFSYGLGNLKGGKLGITVGGTLAVNREMTVIAYVADPQPGETATLVLPEGFEFLANSAPTQPVPEAERGGDGKIRPSPVTWRIRPTVEGRQALSVTTSTGLSVSQPVTIRKKGIF
jgi:hypothetical protein